MAECDTIEAQLAGYVDDELSAAARQAVATHLSSCASCRGAEAIQRQVRSVIRAQAADLREPAPAALRAAVSRRPVLVRSSASAWTAPWRWVPLPMAAALVIAVAGVVVIGALAPRGAVLAAQLTLDHLKCALITRAHPHEQPGAAAEQWSEHRGWDVVVPPSSPDGDLQFVELRRCLYSGGEAAHLVYETRSEGRSVSLFVLPRERQVVPEVEIMGHETVTWAANGRTYAVVGALPAADLQRVVAYLRDRVR